MAVQLICCSHSPLMVTGIEETEKTFRPNSSRSWAVRRRPYMRSIPIL